MKKFLCHILACQLVAFSLARADEPPPNPYQIFTEEKPQVFPIQTNQLSRTEGDAFPDLTQRPIALRPGPIPAGVRYAFASDSTVIAASVLVSNRFCQATPAGKCLFARSLVVHPGAWTDLIQTGKVGIKSATLWGFIVWDGQVNQQLAGVVLRDQDELEQAEAHIRQEVQAGGGAKIRALSSAEMKKWWIFIGFDIQEPTVVLETKDKRRQFILGFVNHEVVVLDELNYLPNFQSPPPTGPAPSLGRTAGE